MSMELDASGSDGRDCRSEAADHEEKRPQAAREPGLPEGLAQHREREPSITGAGQRPAACSRTLSAWSVADMRTSLPERSMETRRHRRDATTSTDTPGICRTPKEETPQGSVEIKHRHPLPSRTVGAEKILSGGVDGRSKRHFEYLAFVLIRRTGCRLAYEPYTVSKLCSGQEHKVDV